MKKETKVKNIEELRNNLIDLYDDLRAGKIGIREAKEHANVAGKIMGSAKVQLEYNAYMKASAKIDFLEV